jgi:hypothetical protein
MTDHPVRSIRPAQSSVASLLFPYAALASALVIAIGVSGCAERKRPSFVWQSASVVRPRLPASAKSEQAAEEQPPELRIALPATLASFPPGTNFRPPRPRVATPQPAPVEASKPQTPFVAPQLSAEESSTAQQETTASLAAAEKGLVATQGKSLNATQSDMVSKITGFMGDARGAGATGDWTSARTIARKAQLLAEELAKSLE